MPPVKDSAPASSGAGGLSRPRPRLDATCAPARPDASRREPPRSSPVSTTMAYPYALNRRGCSVRSPVDLLERPTISRVLGGNRIKPQWDERTLRNAVALHGRSR